MEWYGQVQFISAVPMPLELADEYGTTVNGMWADPERSSSDAVMEAHRSGRRALFSVPMLALTPRVYEKSSYSSLLEEVCRDIGGGNAVADWYWWESRPVYSACIYSDEFRRYLLDRCKAGIDRGMDVVNLDEIMTSVGLMSREPGGSGFCTRCLERFRGHLRAAGDAELAAADDPSLRDSLRTDDRLYERYHRFHEREAFHVTVGFIEQLRAYAEVRAPGFAVSANVAYMGNNVVNLGPLWGCLWAPHLEFVLMENDYRAEPGGAHLLLPRGKFTAWYKLGAAVTGTPAWICPSVHVPRQLAGQNRRRYYELMFLEAYANAGRWGYYWWPGVDPDSRRKATAPEALKGHIRFIAAHRELYEQPVSMNDLAVLYLDGPILRRPQTHQKYLALAQALAETSYQFDVLYTGDGEFNPDQLDLDVLRRYRTILVPEARDLATGPARQLERYARSGGEIIIFSESPLDPSLARLEDGNVLFGFWRRYRNGDRDRIVSTVEHLRGSRIVVSDPSINALRYSLDGRHVLHLLNYGYQAEGDRVVPVQGLQVRVPWTGGAASATIIRLDDERTVSSTVEDGDVVLDIGEIDLYALVVVEGHET
jgi:hypothetical protein